MMGTITSSELRDYATVVTATVALLVFALNSLSQIRNRRIENLSRFNQVHQRLFAPQSYLGLNVVAIESGAMMRDPGDPVMEAKFHHMLLEIERLAVLANNKAVPPSTQVYLFGSYARHILRLLTEEERKSMFWELAVGYLERIAKDTETYQKLERMQRAQFWR